MRDIHSYAAGEWLAPGAGARMPCWALPANTAVPPCGP